MRDKHSRRRISANKILWNIFWDVAENPSRTYVEVSFPDLVYWNRRHEGVRVVGKIKFTHLDNVMIADELPNAIEDESEAHAKHN